MKCLIGLAAGAAVVYFLQTDKGKAFMESVQKETESLGDCIADLAGNLFKKGTDVADKATGSVA